MAELSKKVPEKQRRGPGALLRGVDMTTGTIWKKLLLFAVPILLTNILQQLFNTVDTAIVGALDSSTALAAVGSVGSLVSLVVSFFIGISTGAGVVVSRRWGSLLAERAKADPNEAMLGSDEKAVHDAVHTAFMISLITGTIVTILGITLSPLLLTLMNSPETVKPLSLIYLRIYFSGMVPVMLYNTASGILRAIGDSNRPLIYLMIAGIANVFLDLITIGIFRWGVWGAALATVVSNMVATALALNRLLRADDCYKLKLRCLTLNRQMLPTIIKIGIPTGIQSSLYAISNIVIQSNINIFGEDAMAGVAAVGTIDGFLYMPIAAFGLASMTFAGQNFGAGKPERVHKAVKSAMAMVMSFDIVLAAIILLIGEKLIYIFTQGNAEAVKYGLSMLYMLAPTYFLFAPTEVLSGAIRGAGAALQSMAVTAFFICFVRVSIMLVFVPIYNDIRVVFAAYPITWVLCSLAFIVYYRFGNWKKKSF
ncbi:MAG: MATE family efflux transporter [Clostridiales bacterium]|nr:MATE family efflux transporter [Clostridiales bacterium]